MKAATLETVREEIGARLGRVVTDGDVQHIVSRVGSARFWDEYRFAEDGFAKAELAVRSALAALPDVTGLPEAARAIAGIAELDSIRDRLTACADELSHGVVPGRWKRAGRSVLADPLVFKGAMWWWGPDGATNRDRALISLLAGHWPSLPTDADGQLDESVTPEIVIQREAKNIAQAQNRRRRRTRPT